MTTNEDDRIVDKRAAARMRDDDQPQRHEGSAKDTKTNEEAGAEDAGKPIEEQLAEALARAEENYKSWQRSAADFINYKRRVEQERGEQARFAGAALVINLLPVYDDLARAVETVDAHLAGLNWAQGVLAIQRKFAQLLEAMGVTEIAAAGEAFDPTRHEAVGKQPGEDGKVVHVLQKGYLLGDKVLRPAMVIVGEAT
jgi:molecular chaperone GrpE